MKEFTRRAHFLLPMLMVLLASARHCVAAPLNDYLAFVRQSCDATETRIPQMTQLAETVAERHIAGGLFGVIWEPPSATGPQGTQYEMKGRSGGLAAFDVNLKSKLATASRDKDVALIGWQRAPGPTDLEILKKYHEKYFIIAFGPRDLPELAEFVPLCDAWIDTGLGADDRVLKLADGSRAGRGNMLVNTLNSWTFLGEVVAALTRRGKMPVILKSHTWEDSKEWNGRYRGKMTFHDDLTIAPIPAGTLSRRYLDGIRELVKRFEATQTANVGKAADLIVAELAQGRKTVVAQTGHTTFEYVGKYEDAVWAAPEVLYDTAGRIKQYPELTPEGALALRLGYSGEDRKMTDVMRAHKQRIMLIASLADKGADAQLQPDVLTAIDMGWDFGDALVMVEGYPIRIFPPSGVMQLVAYETVNVEVLARLAAKKTG